MKSLPQIQKCRTLKLLPTSSTFALENRHCRPELALTMANAMNEEEIANLLAEQKAYYEARASEYDEWWERRGRYDFGPESNAAWKREISVVEEAFDRIPLQGHVLEPAAGTGNWTPVPGAARRTPNGDRRLRGSVEGEQV
jgi:hypothetical protein